MSYAALVACHAWLPAWIRRVIDHVRKQERTAIWIDLLIVVVGVFIGIQVSNWNDDRATMRRAAVFSERLRSDLREEAWSYEMQVGYYTDVAAHGRRALDALTRYPVSLNDHAIRAWPSGR